MNSPASKPNYRRIAATLGVAIVAAALMLAAAWLKQSSPTGSWSETLCETAILALAVVAVLIPTLALRPLNPNP